MYSIFFYLVIGFVWSTSQFAEDLIVDVVVIERVETLAVVRVTRVEGRVETEQVIISRKHVACNEIHSFRGWT